MFNRQYFPFYWLIFILFMNCIFCTTCDNAYISDFGDSKAVSIDSEELIRRRNIVENYLKENNNPEKKNWLETYHHSFPGRSVFTSKKIVRESSLENENELHATFPFQNEDLPPLKNLDDSVHLYETLLTGKNLGDDSKDEIVSTKTGSNRIQQKPYKSDNNGNENQDSPRSDYAVSIDSEELIHRRNLVGNYLKEIKNQQKDWIETYHYSFSGRSVFTSKEIVQESSLEDKNELHATFPFQNEDLPPLKKLDDSVHLYETLLTVKNLGDDSKDEIVSTGSNKIQQESYKSDKNGNENQDSARNDNVETYNSCASTEISETNNNMVSKNSGKKPSRSKSNKMRKFPIDCDMLEDDKLDPAVKYFSKVKNDDLRLNEFKNLSIDADKIIQIMLKNSKFTSVKYFIHSETLTLTEFNKLKEYLSSLSFLQKSKNDVYSINRMKIIDSIGKVTPLFKQDEFNKKNQKQSCKFSNIDNDIATETFNSEDNYIKKSAPDFKKRVGHRTQCKEITTQKRLKGLSLLEHEKGILPSSIERSDRNYFFHDSEILRRKELINSFLITLNNNQENWVETYHLNYVKSKTRSKNTFNLQTTEEQNNEFFKIHSQERFYIIRWINKLQNKLKDPHIDYRSLSISVSADLYEILGKLSREFDIVMFDELVNNMIANATLLNYANTLYFDYENIFNVPKIYIFIILLFSYIFLYNLFCKTGLNYNFTLYRVIFVKYFKWILLITVLSSSFYLTGYKMYQQKIAEKQSVMSRVVPSYCESILNKESGVFAHIEEWFRIFWHDEDCRKYYEAVMVDPSSEITFFSISTDLLSDAIFQMLQPLARNMNTFFKALTYDLSFIQQFFIVILTFFIVLFILYFILSFFAFRRNYRVTFPFHLGSVEPTEFCKGSRVEEIEEKETSPSKDLSTSCNTSQINYHDKTENKNYTEHAILKEKFLKIEPNQFKLYALKQSVPKAPRTRHNSI